MSTIQATISQQQNINAEVTQGQSINASISSTNVTGINSFEGLSDTNSFSGNAGKVPVVNMSESELEYTTMPSGDVSSVNTQTGDVVLDADDIDDSATTKKFTTAVNLSKLSGIEANAEVNNISDADATDLTDGGNSTLHYHDSDRDRSNHTGTQTASTISNFDTEVSNNADVSANTSSRHTRSHAMTSTGDHSAGNHKIFYSDGSGIVQELTHGASGEVLTSNGATSAPSWQTGGGGSGDVELITSGSFSTPTASFTLAGLSLGSYKYVKFVGGASVSSSSSTPLPLKVVLNSDTNRLNYFYRVLGNNNGALEETQSNFNRLYKAVSVYNFISATDQNRWLPVWDLNIFYAGNTTQYTQIQATTNAQVGVASITTTGYYNFDHSLVWGNTSAVTSIQFSPSVGSFEYGEYALYGYL